MKKHFYTRSYLLTLILTTLCIALEPSQILIVVNKDNPASMEVARYYCQQRSVPTENVLELSLGSQLKDSISRKNYDSLIASPIREKLVSADSNTNFRCILLTYGVPYKINKTIPTQIQSQQAQNLTVRADIIAEQINTAYRQLEPYKPTTADANEKINRQKIIRKVYGKMQNLQKQIDKMSKSYTKDYKISNLNKTYQLLFSEQGLAAKLSKLNNEIDNLTAKETNASVDSELAMVMYSGYPLRKWQPNRLNGIGFKYEKLTMMTCRIDGPDAYVPTRLVAKALIAEHNGLKGTAYFDSRGLATDKKFGSFGYFDEAIRKAAIITKAAGIPTVEQKTSELFQPGQCPDTMLYCGWYSLKQYIDAFTFNTGAIGYHIASWEAIDIHDPLTKQWVPAMLADGITATLGAVAEPYLHSFPEPDKFFAEILAGRCLVEAYYITKPFNSWQLILIGDPLYTPFPAP